MIPFSKVNRRGSVGYLRNYQRHHLIPLQVYYHPPLEKLFCQLRLVGFKIDDFDANGILLPCSECEVLKSGRPMHRGPHPRYNELVSDRLSMMTASRREDGEKTYRQDSLQFRVRLLQRGLRKGLISRNVLLRLHRRDPLRSEQVFENIDHVVDRLWTATDIITGSKARNLV